MNLDKKYLMNLQQFKIKDDIKDLPIESNYLYINECKVIFICKHSAKVYHVCASSACHFEPIAHESVFDVLYWTEDLADAVTMFHGYVIRSFKLNEQVSLVHELS